MTVEFASNEDFLTSIEQKVQDSQIISVCAPQLCKLIAVDKRRSLESDPSLRLFTFSEVISFEEQAGIIRQIQAGNANIEDQSVADLMTAVVRVFDRKRPELAVADLPHYFFMQCSWTLFCESLLLQIVEEDIGGVVDVQQFKSIVFSLLEEEQRV